MATLYEYYNTGDDTYYGVYSDIWAAQTFTVGGTAHHVNSIKLKVFKIGTVTSNNLTVSIRATDVNGHPTGADLTSGSVSKTSLPADPGNWKEILLTDYTLSASTKYAIVIRQTGTGSGSRYIGWRIDTSTGYAGQDLETSTDSGATWSSNAAVDGMFEVWYEPLRTLDSGSVGYNYQRKTFYANTLYWLFYSDGTNIIYNTSSDCVTWSAANIIRACSNGYHFSIWFDGTYVHYVSLDTSGGSYLKYRRGTTNSDGTITWSAAEQETSSSPSSSPFPSITVDSAGYPWIGYRDMNSHANVTKSSTNNGTWTTASSFPYTLSTTHSRVCIVPLTSQKVLAIYASLGPTTVKATRWNGSAWGSEKATTSNIISSTSHAYSAVSQGDDVHLVFLKDTTYDIQYVKYSYTSDAWGTEATVQAGTSLTIPGLSIDTSTNVLYCFWMRYPTANHIYYKKYISGAWDASATDWKDESANPLPDAIITLSDKAYAKSAGICTVCTAYTINSSSPYLIKLSYLDVYTSLTVTTQAASSVEETTATGNGNITDLGGGGNCTERGVEWGTVTGVYPNSATDTPGPYGIGAFTKGMTSLSPGTLYYYRAKAYNLGGWIYGAEQSFTTKPNDPSALSDTSTTSSSISLSWTKGTGAEKTMIRYSTTAYPTGPTDGTEGYFDTGSSTTINGLLPDQVYYIRAWSYKTGAPNSGYSDGYSEHTVYTDAPTLPTSKFFVCDKENHLFRIDSSTLVEEEEFDIV